MAFFIDKYQKFVGKKMTNKTNNVVFMSTGLFKHLTDTESYVFAHIAFFASQRRPYNRTFKQTTKAICNKVGYSPNAVRSAIRSLISKNFLIYVDNSQLPEYQEDYNYYDDIAHKLTIGSHEYALKYACSLEKMLLDSKQKQSRAGEREISFFKVYVGKLSSDNTVKTGRNQSKHQHKTLIMHGYLFNQARWNLDKNRPKLTRSVSFLASLLQWSKNTVRRVINTLVSIGILEYELRERAISFKYINPITTLKQFTHSLVAKLLPAAAVQYVSKTKLSTHGKPANKNGQSFKPKSPADAVNYLQSLKANSN